MIIPGDTTKHLDKTDSIKTEYHESPQLMSPPHRSKNALGLVTVTSAQKHALKLSHLAVPLYKVLPLSQFSPLTGLGLS